MFDGILSDVIGRDGHVNETGNGNKNNNSNGGGGDSCADRFSDHSTTPDVASMVGVFERHVTRYHNHVLRMLEPTVETSSSKDTPQSVSFRQEVEIPTAIDAQTSVPVDLRGAGDDVVRMARAVFSDSVRLLWSDSAGSSLAAADKAGSCRNGGGVSRSWEAGRWPSPGPARRPLYIPWRMRHFLAYSCRRTRVTAGHVDTLDVMLVKFKEMRREERASKSSRFVVSDAAAVCANNPKHLAVEASVAAAATLSSTCFPAALGVQLSKNRGRLETSVKPRTNVQCADRGTAAGIHNDDDNESVNETNCRTTKLHHSFSDSDLHKVGQTIGWSELWTKPASLAVNMTGCSRGSTVQLGSKRIESNDEKDCSLIKRGPVYTRNAADAPSVKSNLQPFFAANNRHVPIPTANSAVIQLPVHSHEVGSSSTSGSAATKLIDHREGAESSALGACSRQVQSGQPRQRKPPLPPVKDRRRATVLSSTALSPKKTSTSMSDKVDYCQSTSAAASAQITAARRHQQQKQQHHKRKTETSSLSLCGVDFSQKFINAASGTSGTPVAFQPSQCGLHPVATTAAPASAPIFTAVPAASVILHGALPVGARQCGTTCQGGVLQPVDASLARHHQHLLVAEQPAATCSRLYRPGLSAVGPGGNAAGWGYAAAAPAVARPQPAVCREYLLFGPSSVLLLR